MAIFNNGYPMSYTPQVYQPPIQTSQAVQPTITPQPQQQQYSDMIFVPGKEAAKVYPVARGSSVTLFDSEGDKFYVKTVDNSGMPQKLRTFSYVEIVDEEPHGMSSLASPEIDTSQFVTRQEMNTLVKTVDTLADKVQNIQMPTMIEEKPRANTTKKVKENE
jgi:hypothetical protein